MALMSMVIDSFSRVAMATIVFCVSFHFIFLTLDDIGMTYDEPVFLALEEKQRTWYSYLGQVTSLEEMATLVSRDTLRNYFDIVSFQNEQPIKSESDHPILGRHLANVSYALLRPLVNKLYRFRELQMDRWKSSRLVNALLFGTVCTVLFVCVYGKFGLLPGCLSVVALIGMPRVFGHAHLDTLDFQVSVWWFLSYLLFFRAMKYKWLCWALGLVVGLAWTTQFSGTLILIPLAIWSLLVCERRAIRPLIVSVLVAPVVMVCLQPHWWSSPLEMLYDFFYRSTHRDEYMAHHCFYFGRRYLFGLPWHNAVTLTAVTLPVSTLLLGLLGLTRGFVSLGMEMRKWSVRSCSMNSSHSEKLKATSAKSGSFSCQGAGFAEDHSVLGSLTVMFVFWIFLRSLPSAPGHDGVRLFLPAFVFLSALVGAGVQLSHSWARELFQKYAPVRSRKTVSTKKTWKQVTSYPEYGFSVLVCCFIAFELIWIHPTYLGYYSRIAGHPKGAYGLGFESSYWDDAMTPEVIQWINKQGSNKTILYAPTLDALRTLGYLRSDVRFSPDPRTCDLVVLSIRQSALDPSGIRWHIVNEIGPVFSLKTRDGVTLVAGYSGEAVRRLNATDFTNKRNL